MYQPLPHHCSILLDFTVNCWAGTEKTSKGLSYNAIRARIHWCGAC